MNNICLAKNINLEKISFSKIKKNSYGGKSIYVKYDGNPLVVQTPYMTMPFGLSEYVNEETGYSKYSVDFSFRNMDDSKSVENFFDFLNRFDDFMVESGVKNCAEWFSNSSYNKENIVNALFSRQIRYSVDKETGEINHKYAPTFKLKLPKYNGSFVAEVYDSKNKPIYDDLQDVIKKKMTARAIMKCSGVWFVGGKFGLSWKVIHLQVQKQPSVDEYSRIPDSDSDATDCDDKEENSDVGEMFYGTSST